MTVEYTKQGETVWIRLNAPEKLNALARDDWQAITDALRRAARESHNPVVITGTGRAFCAGDDIHIFAPLTRDAPAAQAFFLDTLYSAFEAIVTHPTPVIAAVNGHAFGGGLELVATCDLAFSVAAATFGIPEGKLGTIPAVFVALAQTHLSFKAANAFAYQMSTYSAAQAQALGIINEVVTGDLDDYVRQVVDDITAASPESVVSTKKFLAAEARDVALPRIKAALRESIDLLETPNLAEGTDAFLAKRAPVFQP